LKHRIHVSNIFEAKPPGTLITLMMEAMSTAEMSVSFYQTTRRSIPEDILLHTRRRDNAKYPN
jgi:hypothetical protein